MAKRPALKTDYWKIEDFFIAAAIRKGADGMKRLIENAERKVVYDGKSYKIVHRFKDGTFTIYSDGRWSYSGPPCFLDGRLQCPHASGWIKKMIDKGTPGEFARADHAKYHAIRHQK